MNWLKVFVVFAIFFLTNQEPIGCLIWRNSFIYLEKEKQSVLSFTIKSKQQKTGWIGVGALQTKKKITNNDFSMIAYLPNTFIQINDHQTQITSKKKIWNEKFEDVWFNEVDGIISFSFKINSTEFNDKNYFFIAINDLETPYNLGNKTVIPKHNKLSE